MADRTETESGAERPKSRLHGVRKQLAVHAKFLLQPSCYERDQFGDCSQLCFIIVNLTLSLRCHFCLRLF